MALRFKPISEPNPNDEISPKKQRIDLGNESEVVYFPKFMTMEESWKFFDYLNNQIPWTRPTIRVFGRSCLQPRDTCYVASEGVTQLIYSGYKPHAYSWDDFPLLKDILEAVHKALPGSRFNSLLLNRYKGGSDYVGWHADDEKLYGSTPEIASVSFGCERQFLLKKKPSKSSQGTIRELLFSGFNLPSAVNLFGHGEPKANFDRRQKACRLTQGANVVWRIESPAYVHGHKMDGVLLLRCARPTCFGDRSIWKPSCLHD